MRRCRDDRDSKRSDRTQEAARAVGGGEAAAELVRAAKEQGLSLTGPDGLLKQLTKTVLETALNEEMTEPQACFVSPAEA